MKKAVVVGVVILVAIVGITYFSAQNNEVDVAGQDFSSIKEVPVTARVIQPQTRDLHQSITAHGRFVANSQVNVIPKGTGRIKKVFVEIGDQVSVGDPLIQIEDQEVRLQLKQAEAALKLAESSLAKVKGGARPEEVEQAMANLEQAEANYRNVQSNYERSQYLYDEGVISASEWEAIQTQYEVAKAQQLAAQKTLDMVIAGATEEDIQAAEASVAQAQVAVELSELAVENTTITTPISGQISRLNRQVGEMVSPGMAVGSVVDLDLVKLIVQVPSKDVVRLHQDQKVTVTVDSLSQQQFVGLVNTISPAADESSGMFTVELLFENPDHLLRPGMYGSAQIIVMETPNVLALPQDAIHRENGQDYVFLLEEDTVREVPIQTELVSGNWIQILSGIAEGDAIAIGDFLEDGAVVQVIDWGDQR